MIKFLCIVGVVFSTGTIQGQQWATNGNNIYSSNSGNVGIGTTAPLDKLSVYGRVSSFYDVTNYPNMRALISHDGNGGGLTLTAQGANNAQGGSGDIRFMTSTTNSSSGSADAPTAERMRILFNGNVGIGTATPSGRLVVRFDSASSISDTGASVRLERGDSGENQYDPGPQITFAQRWYTGNSSTVRTGAIRGYKTGCNGCWGGGLQWLYQPESAEDMAVGVTLTGSGNLGVGTANPSSKLHVDGDVTITGNISAKYQDLAEWVPTARSISPGSVVVLDTNIANSVLPSTIAYDTHVAGVVSAEPGIVLGERGENKVKVATTGRVRVRVDATRNPIRIGDLLVTSDKEGVAMRSEALDIGGRKIHQPGTLIGKALEPLSEGEGEILVLLSLQ